MGAAAGASSASAPTPKDAARYAPVPGFVRYLVAPVQASAVARRAAPDDVVLDGGRAVDERVDRAGRVGAVCGGAGGLRAKHGATVQPLAIECADRRAAAVRGLTAGRAEGVLGRSAACGAGHDDAVGYVLRGASIVGVAQTFGAG